MGWGELSRKENDVDVRESRRLRREKETISAMIALYCRSRHSGEKLCYDCGTLLSYAELRIEQCRFHDSKPPCNQCKVHCCSRPMRDEVRAVKW